MKKANQKLLKLHKSYKVNHSSIASWIAFTELLLPPKPRGMKSQYIPFYLHLNLLIHAKSR